VPASTQPMCAGVMAVGSAFQLRHPESSSYAIVNVLVKPNVRVFKTLKV
jgi:hypothetical protein